MIYLNPVNRGRSNIYIKSIFNGMDVSCFFYRLSALKSLLHNLLQAEDIIKVNEARLTEKETSSLDLKEVASYQSTLKVGHTSMHHYNKDHIKRFSKSLFDYDRCVFLC